MSWHVARCAIPWRTQFSLRLALNPKLNSMPWRCAIQVLRIPLRNTVYVRPHIARPAAHPHSVNQVYDHAKHVRSRDPNGQREIQHAILRTACTRQTAHSNKINFAASADCKSLVPLGLLPLTRRASCPSLVESAFHLLWYTCALFHPSLHG